VEESIVDQYISILETSSNKNAVLVSFASKVLGIDAGTETFKMIGSLINKYGANRVFLAILEASDMQNLDTTKNMYQLLSYFCRKNVDKDINANPNLPIIKPREINKPKRIKFRRLEDGN